jgi:hypothetical protein
VSGELHDQVGASLDQQVLAHLQGEAEHGRQVGRTRRLQQLADGTHGLCRERVLRFFRAQPREQPLGHRPVEKRRGLRERRRRVVPLRRRLVAHAGAAQQIRVERALLVLLLGHEALDRRHVNVVEARLAQQRHEVVLLLAHAGVADRQDLQQAQQLVPAGPGHEREPPHSVPEQPERERAFAVALEVDHLAAKRELERVHLEQ